MCGIVGFVGEQNAAPILLKGLRQLEYRGYDSAGIAVMDAGTICVEKVSGRIARLCEKTENGAAVPGSIGIGHTRWATHGAPTDVNAHPHLSNDGRFAIVHNGIIENYLALREELIADGYVFQSETDTETIVHLLEMYYDGDIKTAVMKTAARLEGSYALGILCADAPDTLYAVRQASPLILGIGVGENFFASDVTALVAHTKNVIYLEDGEIAMLTPKSIQVFDCTGKLIQKPISRVTWSVEAAEKGPWRRVCMRARSGWTILSSRKRPCALSIRSSLPPAARPITPAARGAMPSKSCVISRCRWSLQASFATESRWWMRRRWCW